MKNVENLTDHSETAIINQSILDTKVGSVELNYDAMYTHVFLHTDCNLRVVFTFTINKKYCNTMSASSFCGQRNEVSWGIQIPTQTR
jgi:hypothetical protein